jgi:type III secretion protein Q
MSRAMLAVVTRRSRTPGPADAGERPMTLPAATLEEVEGANRLYRHRAPLQLSLLGRAATITPSWQAEGADGAGRGLDMVQIGVDGRMCELLVPADLLDVILRETDASLADTPLYPDEAALVLELALAENLDALAGAANCRLSIVSIAANAASAGSVPHPTYRFALTIAELGSWHCGLRMAPSEVSMLARSLDRAAPAHKASLDGLMLPVALRVGASRATIGELEDLELGDVILLDEVAAGPVSAVAVIAEHLVAPIEFTANGARLATPPKRGRGSTWEWSMDRPSDSVSAADKPDAAVDDIPVRVVFEIGRVELPLQEVQTLAPGAMVPLLRPTENAVDIMVHGRRLGRGSLVKIGDSLGVRIVRLADYD